MDLRRRVWEVTGMSFWVGWLVHCLFSWLVGWLVCGVVFLRGTILSWRVLSGIFFK